MSELKFRLLTAREIECRVAQISKKCTGLSLLLYKDARCDMNILDETVGPMNWKRLHTRDNNNCIVSIWDTEKTEWVPKEDVGTESNTEAAKGLASDSFKRACVNWGIGRELYTAPFIWIPAANCNIKNEGGRLKCSDSFSVTEIGYNEYREIDLLVIVNDKTKSVAFQFGVAGEQSSDSSTPGQAPAQPSQGAKPASGTAKPATEEQIKYIKDKASDDDYVAIMQQYGAELENLTYEDAERVMDEIDDHNADAIMDEHVKCERCQGYITGAALPDGTTMTGPEIVAKSKITYGGIYCWQCMKELKRARAKRKAG